MTKQPVYQDPDNRSVSALAATPDGKFLFASETAGSGTNLTFFLQTLTVNSSTGTLSAAGTIPAFSAGEAIADWVSITATAEIPKKIPKRRRTDAAIPGVATIR